MSAIPHYSPRYPTSNLSPAPVWLAEEEVETTTEDHLHTVQPPISDRHLAALGALLREKGLIGRR